MFVTVYRATYTTELIIVKGRLEAEGISCIISDENTLNSNPMYSNAIGGARLKVKEEDLLKAQEILIDLGYPIKAIEDKETWFDQVNTLICKIPIFKKIELEKRLFLFFILLILIVFILTYFYNIQ